MATLTPAGFALATLTSVATLTTTAPGSAETFRFIELLSGASGLGVLRGATASRLGLYQFSSAGALEAVADTSTVIPGTALTFSDFSRFAGVGPSGLIAFRGQGPDHAGVFRAQSGSIATIADTVTTVPGTNAALFTTFDARVGAGSARVAFRATSDDREGIYQWTGSGLVAVADTLMAVPGGGGALFTGFSAPVVSGSRVAFRARGPDLEGVYVFDSGVLTAVADTATVVPGGVSTFTGFDERIALSDASVAFLGKSGDLEGIYRRTSSGLAAVLETGQTAPGGSVVTDLWPPVAASDEQVAFRADGVDASAILRLSGGVLSQIAAVGSAIPGGTHALTGLSRLSASNGTLSFRGSSADYDALYFRDATGLRAVADVNTSIPGAATPFFAFDAILALDASVVIDGGGSEATGVFQAAVPPSVALPASSGQQVTIGAGLGTTGGGTLSLPASAGGTLSAAYNAIAAAEFESATGINPATLPFQTASEPIQVWTVVYDGSVEGASHLELSYDPSGIANEAPLVMYMFDGVAWVALAGPPDVAANSISVDTMGFGIFVLAASSSAIPVADPLLIAVLLALTLAVAMSRSRHFIRP